jgi:polysaccharide export outer membrane protein
MRLYGQCSSPGYMKRITFKSSLFASVVCLFFSACTSTRTSYYFKELKKDTSIAVFVDSNLDVRIHPTDVISVLISSLDKSEDVLFNTQAYIGGVTGGYTSIASSYLVDDSGNIQMHKLGLVHVEGMTLKEFKQKLEKDLLQPYLLDPIVTVSFSNHKITVMGQVGKSQLLEMTGDHISIIDAFILSGDVTANADMKNVLIIREKDNIKQFKYVNLENPSFIDSSWYYLHANDIVYVNPDFKKLRQEGYRSDIQQNIGLFASIISLAVILITLTK